MNPLHIISSKMAQQDNNEPSDELVERTLQILHGKFQGDAKKRLEELMHPTQRFADELLSEIKENTISLTPTESAKEAKGVSRRLFFVCDFKPKHVNEAELRLALACDIPTYVLFFASKSEAKQQELYILTRASELVINHTISLLRQEKIKKPRPGPETWLLFSAFRYMFRVQILDSSGCSECGNVLKGASTCGDCGMALCPTCQSHTKEACEELKAEHKVYIDKYYPTLLQQKDIQFCEACLDFEKPKLYCCKGAYYCNKECQVKDRKKHKSVCVRNKKQN
jgi:hypothetical protein